MLGPVPPGTLSARLDELAGAGVLERRVVNARPPRTEYVLTERGQRLAALLDALEALGSPASRRRKSRLVVGPGRPHNGKVEDEEADAADGSETLFELRWRVWNIHYAVVDEDDDGEEEEETEDGRLKSGRYSRPEARTSVAGLKR